MFIGSNCFSRSNAISKCSNLNSSQNNSTFNFKLKFMTKHRRVMFMSQVPSLVRILANIFRHQTSIIVINFFWVGVLLTDIHFWQSFFFYLSIAIFGYITNFWGGSGWQPTGRQQIFNFWKNSHAYDQPHPPSVLLSRSVMLVYLLHFVRSLT